MSSSITRERTFDKMKSVKNLLIPFIVMLVLVGVAVVVVITNNKPDPTEQTAEANEMSLTSILS